MANSKASFEYSRALCGLSFIELIHSLFKVLTLFSNVAVSRIAKRLSLLLAIAVLNINMKSRAALINATLELTSQPTKGVQLVLNYPL